MYIIIYTIILKQTTNNTLHTAHFTHACAYARAHTIIRYCQGSAFIVALLLMHMPEEEAFNVFCILMRDFGLRSLFRPTMSGLTLRLHQFECLVADVYPELHAHFTDMMIPTSSYASQWFLTLFGSALPLPCVERFVHYPTDYFHKIQGSCWGATSTYFLPSMTFSSSGSKATAFMLSFAIPT